jgi:hypothetical protein
MAIVIVAVLAAGSYAGYLCWSSASGPWPVQLVLAALGTVGGLVGALLAICTVTALLGYAGDGGIKLWQSRPLKQSAITELSDEALDLLGEVVQQEHGMRQSLIPPPSPALHCLRQCRLVRYLSHPERPELFVYAHRHAGRLREEEIERRERKLLQFATPGALSRQSGLAE